MDVELSSIGAHEAAWGASMSTPLMVLRTWDVVDDRARYLVPLAATIHGTIVAMDEGITCRNGHGPSVPAHTRPVQRVAYTTPHHTKPHHTTPHHTTPHHTTPHHTTPHHTTPHHTTPGAQSCTHCLLFPLV